MLSIILRRLSVCIFSFPELHRHQPIRITPRVIATNLREFISSLLVGFQLLKGLYRPSAVSAVAPLYCLKGPLESVVSYSERDESTMVFPQPLSQSVFL